MFSRLSLMLTSNGTFAWAFGYCQGMYSYYNGPRSQASFNKTPDTILGYFMFKSCNSSFARDIFVEVY